MKLLSSLLLLAVAAYHTALDWTTTLTEDLAQKVIPTKTPQPTQASATTATAIFDGSYADPNHPNCKRTIQVINGDAASISGTDGNPGCPPDGSGMPWKLEGKVEGPFILVDFSPKGGPQNLLGVYDNTAPEGIQWPDGNKWTKI